MHIVIIYRANVLLISLKLHLRASLVTNLIPTRRLLIPCTRPTDEEGAWYALVAGAGALFGAVTGLVRPWWSWRLTLLWSLARDGAFSYSPGLGAEKSFCSVGEDQAFTRVEGVRELSPPTATCRTTGKNGEREWTVSTQSKATKTTE